MSSAPTAEAAIAPRSAPAVGTAWLGAAAVFALHLAVKVPGLAGASLWLDEAFAVHVAQRDFAGILRASQADTTPPVYYLLLAGFERVLGTGEAAARLPSALASALAAAALFALARRTLGRFAAWVASLLFLLSDVNLFFAREARPYALAVLLAIASFAAFLAFQERPSWRRAWLLAAVNLVMVLTHYVTIFAPVAQLLVLLASRAEPKLLRRFVAASAPALGATLLWMAPVIESEQHAKMGWLTRPGARIGRMVGWYAGGMRWPGIFLLLLAGALASLLWARHRGAAPAGSLVWTFGLWGTAPIVLAFLVSFASPCLHARYLLYVTPGLILFWTAGITALPAGWARISGAAAACALAGAGLGRSLHHREYDWRSAAAFTRAAQVERVLLMPEWEAPTLAYYLDPLAFRDPDRTRAALEARGVRLLSPESAPSALELAGVRDLLLIEGGPGLGPRSGDLTRRLLAEQAFSPTAERSWPGVHALRFSRALPAGP